MSGELRNERVASVVALGSRFKSLHGVGTRFSDGADPLAMHARGIVQTVAPMLRDRQPPSRSFVSLFCSNLYHRSA